MARFFKKREQLLGTAPGSVIFVGNKKEEKPIINIIEYDKDTQNIYHDVKFEELQGFKNSPLSTWINIYGLHDTELIQSIGELFDLDPLTLEDIANTSQRPKFEEFDSYLFLALKMLNFEELEDRMDSEYLTIIIGENYLLSFQERTGDVFKSIRDRLNRESSKIRSRGTNYLGYALLDAVVDRYVFIIEQFGDRIEKLEIEIIDDPNPELLSKLNENKKEIAYLRKVIRPVREMTVQMKKSDSKLLGNKITHFVADLDDLVTHCTETIEIYSEMLSDQYNFYSTSMANRLNDIMKTLTIFSVIFIPLTFIAGIYGTNFEYFPELKFRYAYPVFWGVIMIIGISMFLYFRRKKWF